MTDLNALFAGADKSYPNNEAERLVLADFLEETGNALDAVACRNPPVPEITRCIDHVYGLGGMGDGNGNGYGGFDLGFGDGSFGDADFGSRVNYLGVGDGFGPYDYYGDADDNGRGLGIQSFDAILTNLDD